MGPASHNYVPECSKLAALQRLCEEFSNHVIHQTVFDAKAFFIDLIRHEEIANIKVTGTPTAGHLNILF
jgi:hypothetical protein